MKTYMKTIALLGLLGTFFGSCTGDDGGGPPKLTTTDEDKPFTKTITYPSIDGIEITADHYHLKDSAPVIVLCHQGEWSRGEYLDIAPKLNSMGYNALAIDQRAGSIINGVQNQTNKAAGAAQKSVNFIDAKQDIIASINWAKNNYKTSKVILWGSSYSASLALIITAERKEDISKVLAFSPGEHLPGISVRSAIGGVNGVLAPAFLTSSMQERIETEKLYEVISSSEYRKQFLPSRGNGQHGSRNLWPSMPDQEEYWKAVEIFLKY